MNDNSFIDTNILVYCYTNDEPDKNRIALNVVSSPNTYISTQVLTELSNILNRKLKLSWEDVEKAVSEVSSDFNVFVNKPETIEHACRIAEQYKYSFYDSLIVAAALACNCTILYSEDMHDGITIDNKLKIINPLK